MEQPCYKCGQAVEQGVPFCPHCSAPQIRVVIAEVAMAGVGASDAPLNPPGAAASPSVPMLAISSPWSLAVRPCALAALIAAVGMVCKLIVPVIAVIGAGFLAVSLYRRNNPTALLRAGTGARLGALCGLFCSAMTAALGALRVLALHEGGEIRKTMLDVIQQSASRYSDPQSQSALELLRSPTGLVLFMIVLLIFGCLMFILMGTVGGALGAAVLGRRDRS
jgi:hypothetical protein